MSKVSNSREISGVSIDSSGTETVRPVQSDPLSSSTPQPQRAISTHKDASVSLWNLPVMEKQEDLQKEDMKTKLARLEREAYEKGFEQGQKDGLSLEKKKMEETGKELEALFLEINNLKVRIYSESEEELLKLCLAIAKKVIHAEVRINKEILRNTIQSALTYVADKRRIRIIINPEDMEDVRRLLPDFSKLTKSGRFQLTEDNMVEKGGCMIETGFGKVNAGMDDQFGVIQEEIERIFLENHGDLHETHP